jgi:peptidoglycan/xylan/chitin deacetylase (PgdA/CDA1 family)
LNPKRAIKAVIARTPIPEMLVRHKGRSTIVVLGYHRIGPPAAPHYPFNEELFSATPEEFARELKYLRENLDVISTAELLRGLKNPALLPARPAVITFDDGYWDNEEIALPLLRDAGLTACFFLCSQIVGTGQIPWYERFVCCLKNSRAKTLPSPFGKSDPPYDLAPGPLAESIRRFRRNLRRLPWPDVQRQLNSLEQVSGVQPEQCVERPMFMSWAAVNRLVAAGMEIGAHARNHPMLSRIDDSITLQDEIAGSRRDLEDRLGIAPRAFAYPFGSDDAMSPEADEEIRRAGFEISFSYIPRAFPRLGPVGAGIRFRLPRLPCEHGDNHASFRLAMATARVAAFDSGTNLNAQGKAMKLCRI